MYPAGKRGRHAPCLIPRDSRNAMEILVKQREKAGVLSTNPYVFALPNKPDSYLDAWKALNDFVKSADLEMPEFITSTKLRKYLGKQNHCLQIHNYLKNNFLARFKNSLMQNYI